MGVLLLFYYQFVVFICFSFNLCLYFDNQRNNYPFVHIQLPMNWVRHFLILTSLDTPWVLSHFCLVWKRLTYLFLLFLFSFLSSLHSFFLSFLLLIYIILCFSLFSSFLLFFFFSCCILSFHFHCFFSFSIVCLFYGLPFFFFGYLYFSLSIAFLKKNLFEFFTSCSFLSLSFLLRFPWFSFIISLHVLLVLFHYVSSLSFHYLFLTFFLTQ